MIVVEHFTTAIRSDSGLPFGNGGFGAEGGGGSSVTTGCGGNGIGTKLRSFMIRADDISNRQEHFPEPL